MRAKDVLLEALSKYHRHGRVGLARSLLHRQSSHAHLRDRSGHVHVFPGNYEDYLWRKLGGPEKLEAVVVTESLPSRDSNGAGSSKRVNPMKLQKVRDRLSVVEKQVAALESEIAEHEAALADFKNVEETVRLNDLVTARRRELESRVAEWESLSAELEAP